MLRMLSAMFGSGLVLVLVVTIVGCQAGQSTTVPITTPSTPPGPAAIGPERETPPPPNGLTLFGDWPEYEQVPYENRLTTNLRQHTYTTSGLDFDPDLSADGRTIVYASTRNARRADIFMKAVDSSVITQITGDPADDIHPRLSPDQKRIVFCSNRTGNWDVWVINRDGTGLMQLTFDRTDEIAPTWSPDGSRIAFSVWGRRSHRWEIWTMALDRPTIRQFLVYGMFPAWSPDGQHIAFQRPRERGSRRFSSWVVTLVDGEARQPREVAYSDAAACIAPRWSPDGQMLVYCAVPVQRVGFGSRPRQSDNADIWVVDIESGLRMKITDSAATAFNPVWAGDGRIFFVSGQGGNDNIWSVRSHMSAFAMAKQKETNTAAASDKMKVTPASDTP